MPSEASIEHTFRRPWEEISYAVFRKYPCPERPDVLSVDILDSKLDTETGILTTRRLITVKGPLPSWTRVISGRPSTCYFLEEATIDPREQVMTMASRNVTAESLVLMEEKCVYRRHEINGWTKMLQNGKVTSFSAGIGGQIENFLTKMFTQNSSKGREIMERACNIIRQEAAEKLAAGNYMAGEALSSVTGDISSGSILTAALD